MTEKTLTAKRNIPTSLAHLKGVYDRAVIVYGQHGRQIAGFNLEVDRRKAMTARNIDLIVDPKRKEDFAKLYQEEHAEWLKAYRAETSEARWRDAAELNGLREDAMAGKSLLTSVALSTAHNLGEPRRTAIESSLSGLGKAALSNMAARAMVEPDLDKRKDMIAALVTINDKMPRAERPFSSQELADSAWGAEAAQAVKLIADIDRLHAQSVAAVRETEGRPLTPVEKVHHGRVHGGHAVAPRPTVVVKTRTPLEKLGDGLAASHDFGG